MQICYKAFIHFHWTDFWTLQIFFHLFTLLCNSLMFFWETDSLLTGWPVFIFLQIYYIQKNIVKWVSKEEKVKKLEIKHNKKKGNNFTIKWNSTLTLNLISREFTGSQFMSVEVSSREVEKFMSPGGIIKNLVCVCILI